MKGNGIHMQDNDSTVSVSENSSQDPNLTPQGSGTSTPNTLEQEHNHAFDHATLEEDYFHERLPEYEAEAEAEVKNHLPGDELHENDKKSALCAILPQRRAVWMEKESTIKLSALAAGVLVDACILLPKDLSLYPPRSRTPSSTPSDPVSGAFSAVHGIVGGVIGGVADYPIEIVKMAKADRDIAAGLATEFALDSGKGVSRIIGTGLKAPMDVTLNVSRGFGHLPKLYGDETVREEEKVTGIASGLGAAGKGFGLGLYDGITGLVTQPMNGAKKGGLGGFFAGVGKGIGGVVCKPAAGAVGLTAYTFKGVYEEVQNKRNDLLKSTQLGEGKNESMKCSEEDRVAIIEKWDSLVQSTGSGEKERHH